MWRFYFGLILLSLAMQAEAQTLAERNCATLKSRLEAANLPLRELQVPLDYNYPDGLQLNIKYWVRPGQAPTNFPPLLLIHGGPGAGSLRLITWKAVLDNYPGDVIALDERGEGCSNPFPSNLMPEDFALLRARNIVRDLELLRLSLYGGQTQWRVFGQSRGSVIGHYYLDMFPDAIESIHLHGYSMGLRESMKQYSRIRSFFSARVSHTFVERYPKAGEVLKKLKQWLDSRNIVFVTTMQEDLDLKGFVAGSAAIDALSFELTNQANWPTFAAKLEALLSGNEEIDFGIDGTAAYDYLQLKINNNTYTLIMNYVVGTNGQDMGQPDPEVLTEILHDRYIQDAPICEGRYIVNVIMPWYQAQYGSMYKASVDPIDHDRILDFMKDYERKNRKKFRYFLYASDNDTVAGPEAYADEKELFGSYVHYQLLRDTGHDGWFVDPTVARNLVKK